MKLRHDTLNPFSTHTKVVSCVGSYLVISVHREQVNLVMVSVYREQVNLVMVSVYGGDGLT